MNSTQQLKHPYATYIAYIFSDAFLPVIIVFGAITTTILDIDPDRDRLFLFGPFERVPSEDGDCIESPKRRGLNERQNGG
jgi:hypothetical protein